MKETLSWFGKEWIEKDAKALGVYITLLMLRFRVRFSTDIPVLCREEGLMEARLKPYLAIFLKDEKLREAIAAGKGFLNALVTHTSFHEYEEVLDTIEMDFYEILKDAYLRHVNRAEIAGEISEYDATSLIRRFLSDVSSTRFSIGKSASAGSSILLTPFSELMELYGLSEGDVRRFMEILRLSGIMFLDIIPAPVLEKEFIESLV
ncbi:MAG: hypothetical protein IBX41_03185 [Methanophagales archaeon]|nr:hypothetical protein [Methanophagales archaeon]